MTALLRLTTSAPAVPLDPQQWITVGEAAKLLDVTDRHLRRLCDEMLSKQGLAVLATPPEGGNACWMINRRYDLKLGAGGTGQVFQVPVAELARCTEEQRREAWARVKCVELFREARQTWTGNQADWMPTLLTQLSTMHPKLKISERSLRRWYDLYRTPADVVKLVDSRGGNTRGDADPSAWTEFQRLYLSERKPSARACWEQIRTLAHVEGWRWVPYKTLIRQLDQRIPEQLQLRFREPELYRQRLKPFIKQDPDAFAPGECWIGDNCNLDLWCRYRDRVVRPVLTAWIDNKSQRIMGWALSAGADSSTIAAALRMGLLDPLGNGGPRIAWMDNGKDWDSQALHGETKKQRQKRRGHGHDQADEQRHTNWASGGIFKLLSIEAHFSIPFNSNGKSKMERWFGFLHKRFDVNFPTYCGGKPADKPDSLDQILKDGRHIPTFEHVRERMALFVEGYNASADHQREGLEGLSPNDAMQLATAQRRQLAEPKVLDLLMQHWHAPVRCNRDGITISPVGKAEHYGDTAMELIPYKALHKEDRPWLRVSYDVQDVTKIRVYTMDWKFICEARRNDLGGNHAKLGREQLKEAMRRRREYEKAQEVVHANPFIEIQDDFEIAAEILREQAPTQTTPVAFEGGTRLVQTPLDPAVKEMERNQIRKAAGAESMSPRRGRNDDAAIPSASSIFGSQPDFSVKSEAQDDEQPMRWGNFSAPRSSDEEEEQ